MNLAIFAGILSLIPFVYLLRLMTDARQLRERYRARALVYSESAQLGEGLLLELPNMHDKRSGRPLRRTASDLASADPAREAGGPPQAS